MGSKWLHEVIAKLTSEETSVRARALWPMRSSCVTPTCDLSSLGHETDLGNVQRDANISFAYITTILSQHRW